MNRTFLSLLDINHVDEKTQTRREKGVFLEKNGTLGVKKWLLNGEVIAFTSSFDSFYTLKA